MKLRTGDKVIVISGKDKGKVGTIQKVFPKENKVNNKLNYHTNKESNNNLRETMCHSI